MRNTCNTDRKLSGKDERSLVSFGILEHSSKAKLISFKAVSQAGRNWTEVTEKALYFHFSDHIWGHKSTLSWPNGWPRFWRLGLTIHWLYRRLTMVAVDGFAGLHLNFVRPTSTSRDRKKEEGWQER